MLIPDEERVNYVREKLRLQSRDKAVKPWMEGIAQNYPGASRAAGTYNPDATWDEIQEDVRHYLFALAH